jgi:hypothetical protein
MNSQTNYDVCEKILQKLPIEDILSLYNSNIGWEHNITIFLKSTINKNKLDWSYLYKLDILSEKFIREFYNFDNKEEFMHWIYFSYLPLSEGFIRDFQDKLDWERISIHQKLSANFIREFRHKVHWPLILRHQKLSEDFIREAIAHYLPDDKMVWNCLSKHQFLSETFIKEFQDKVEWTCISQFQTLSEPFIREFQNKVIWSRIDQYQTLSETFREEFAKEVKKAKESPIDDALLMMLNRYQNKYSNASAM